MLEKTYLPIAIVICAILIAFCGGLVNVEVINEAPESNMDMSAVGGAPKVSEGILMGSATEYTSWPMTFVDAVSTTTGALDWDAGSSGIITQDINVKNFNSIRFNLGLLGGTVTSTPYMKFQTSPDNVTFYDITGNTGYSTSTAKIGTTTPTMLPTVLTLPDPGINSTTDSFTFDVSSISYLRVLFMADNPGSDPTDGVQGYVNYQLFGEY